MKEALRSWPNGNPFVSYQWDIQYKTDENKVIPVTDKRAFVMQ